MLLLAYLIGFAIAIACSYWCARVAQRKGHNVVLWAVLGIIFPLVAVAVIHLLPSSDTAPR